MTTSGTPPSSTLISFPDDYIVGAGERSTIVSIQFSPGLNPYRTLAPDSLLASCVQQISIFDASGVESRVANKTHNFQFVLGGQDSALYNSTNEEVVRSLEIIYILYLRVLTE